MCIGPEGDGEIRVITFPTLALSSSGSPSLFVLWLICSSYLENSFFCSSGDKELIFFKIVLIFEMVSFTFDFSKPSWNNGERMLPTTALPSCSIAFLRAYAVIS